MNRIELIVVFQTPEDWEFDTWLNQTEMGDCDLGHCNTFFSFFFFIIIIFSQFNEGSFKKNKKINTKTS